MQNKLFSNCTEFEKVLSDSISFLTTLCYTPLPSIDEIQEQGNRLLRFSYKQVEIEILQSSKNDIDYRCVKLLFNDVLRLADKNLMPSNLKLYIEGRLQNERTIDFYISQVEVWHDIIIDKINQLKDTFKEIDAPKTRINLPHQCDENKYKSVMQRGIDARILDSNYMPLAGITQGELRTFAKYASKELGIETPWEHFGTLWHIKNLARVKEENYKADKLEAIKNIFPQEITKKEPRFK